MYIPWQWITEKTKCNSYPVEEFIAQLNYYGLECEKTSTNGVLFINFITAHNRRDLKSWWGLVREITILLALEGTTNPSNKTRQENSHPASQNSSLHFTIKSKQVTEYNILSLDNLSENKQLPDWLSQSLVKNGIKKVNTIVDIANFATLETGQPFHVFDREKLQHISAGEEIIIREAEGGELFTDLSRTERKLSTGSLLMETNGEVVELMGVIGGSSTAVEQTTRQLLVESGCFTPTAIELTCKRLGLRTRASEVFINSYNQEKPRNALERFSEIIGEFYTYQITKPEHFFLASEKEKDRKELIVSTSFLKRKLGITVPQKKLTTILERLGFSFKKENYSYIVKIPSFRPDIKIREDLIEEVGKLLDYNLLPGTLPTFQNQFIDLQFNNAYDLKRKMALYLISNGYQEVLSYSLVENDHPIDSILLANPKSSLHAAYRTSFINSHLEIIKHNQGQGRKDLFFFEIGSVYNRRGGSDFPNHEEILSLIATGKLVNSPVHRITQQVDIYWVKGLLENLLTITNSSKLIMEEGRVSNSLDLDYRLIIDGEVIGFIRQFSPGTLMQNGIGNAPCFALQLSFSKLLLPFKKKDRKYVPVSYLPVITRNISFLIEKDIPLEKVVVVIRKGGGAFLLDVALVDIYDKKNASSLHSLNFQLLFQGKGVNLQGAEVEAEIEELWGQLVREFAVLRR